MHTNVPGVRCVTPCSNRLDLGRYARSITLSTLPPCGVCRSSVPSVDSINYKRNQRKSAKLATYRRLLVPALVPHHLTTRTQVLAAPLRPGRARAPPACASPATPRLPALNSAVPAMPPSAGRIRTREHAGPVSATPPTPSLPSQLSHPWRTFSVPAPCSAESDFPSSQLPR